MRTKGTVRFPLDKPIPLALISKIVKFRTKENLEKADKAKGSQRGCDPKSNKEACDGKGKKTGR